MVNALPKGSSAVAVDLPGGTVAWKESHPSLNECAATLRNSGYRVSLVFGDSTHRKVVEDVRALGPFDAVFIDANHTKKYVAADWVSYGEMARIVAFHDIAWRRGPEFKGVRIDVPQFWHSIKGLYRHEEIKRDDRGKDNGIGVLWRC